MTSSLSSGVGSIAWLFIHGLPCARNEKIWPSFFHMADPAGRGRGGARADLLPIRREIGAGPLHRPRLGAQLDKSIAAINLFQYRPDRQLPAEAPLEGIERISVANPTPEVEVADAEPLELAHRGPDQDARVFASGVRAGIDEVVGDTGGVGADHHRLERIAQPQRETAGRRKPGRERRPGEPISVRRADPCAG